MRRVDLVFKVTGAGVVAVHSGQRTQCVVHHLHGSLELFDLCGLVALLLRVARESHGLEAREIMQRNMEPEGGRFKNQGSIFFDKGPPHSI